MQTEMLNIYSGIQNIMCNECEEVRNCNRGTDCVVRNLLNYIEGLNVRVQDNAEGCHICTGKGNKTKDVFYDDGRGGLRIADYCPNCGREI